MSFNALPFNWFDVTVLVVLLAGLQRGRKRGMSEECLTMLQWVMVVVVAAVAYDPLGQFLTTVLPFSQLFCYLIAYVGAALLVTGVFLLVKRGLSGKLTGSDVFGGAEYYLGMPSGMLRFACVLLAGLALLNARLYRQEEINAMTKFQNDNYGSQFFPTMQTVQDQVFAKSFLGPHIKTHLDFLLIKPTYPEGKQLQRAKSNF